MQQLKPCLSSGLLCLSTAKEGGLTSWSSSGSIYNRLLQSHPDYVQVCVMHSNSQEIDCELMNVRIEATSLHSNTCRVAQKLDF